MVLYERSGEDIDRGLIGHWKLNDLRVSTSTAIDRATFHDGTITEATGATGHRGKTLSAMQFDGTNDIISIGAVSGFPEIPIGGDPVTVSAWVNFDLNDTEEIVFSWGSGGTGTEISFGRMHAGGTENALGLHRGGGRLNLSANNVLMKSTWYHIVMTFDGSDFIGFIDGVEQSTATFASDVSGGNVYLGRRASTGSLFMDGKIQDVRVYNRVLTHGEINKLFRLKL